MWSLVVSLLISKPLRELMFRPDLAQVTVAFGTAVARHLIVTTTLPSWFTVADTDGRKPAVLPLCTGKKTLQWLQPFNKKRNWNWSLFLFKAFRANLAAIFRARIRKRKKGLWLACSDVALSLVHGVVDEAGHFCPVYALKVFQGHTEQPKPSAGSVERRERELCRRGAPWPLAAVEQPWVPIHSMNRASRAACRPLCGTEGGRILNTTVEMQKLLWCFGETFSPWLIHRNNDTVHCPHTADDELASWQNRLIKLQAKSHQNSNLLFSPCVLHMLL